MTEDLQVIVNHRFCWQIIDQKTVLIVDLTNATEDEFIATTFMLRPIIEESEIENDIRVLVNMQHVKFTAKMIFHSMQVAKYSIKKVSRRAGVGFSPATFALYRIARLNKPNTRIFKTYDEAITYLVS